jgi:imidazolonepropionase
MTPDPTPDLGSELITGIGELTTQSDGTPRIAGAAIVLEAGRIAWIGPSAAAPAADRRTDIGGRAVLPGWVDPHTHLVFAGDRSAEFEARMAGRRYAAGGIVGTVTATRAATEAELLATASALRREAAAQGTTFLETKTGYGLDAAAEERSARVAARVADVVTFLGAHVVPPGIDRRAYLDLVTGPMLAAVRPYAQFVDAFCEVGAFDVEESREVLLAGRAAGLGLRLHGNQLGFGGAVRLAVELGCASVDHCNYLAPGDLDALASSGTVATLLPACDLSTREPFAPARALLDAGASIALGTNCNPGTSYTTSMPLMVALAVREMFLTPSQAVYAATAGGAKALRRDDIGRLSPGARADVVVLEAPSHLHLAYRPGSPLVAAVWSGGQLVAGSPA